MYASVLIPLDGSALAEQVLPYARFLAAGSKLPIELLQVIDLENLSLLTDPERGRYIDKLLEEKTADADAYLKAIARTFEAGRVTCVVAKGKAEDAIIDRADGEKQRLIVMATHGRSGIQRWLLGSVADRVLHGSASHVLLIRAYEPPKNLAAATLKTVIVPLDGSPLAESVLPTVVALGKILKLDVILIRTYTLPPAIAADQYATYSDELVRQLETEAQDYLTEKVTELKKNGLGNVSSRVVHGYAAEQIIGLARHTQDNFVAIGSHGRSGIKRWALGSVADRVVQHSGDPVLIVRGS